MKVLYIVTAFPRDETDVITPWLQQTIHHLRPRGVEVEVLAPSYRGLASQTIFGIRVHRFRYAPAAWETLTHDQTAPDRIRERPLFAALLPGYLTAGSIAAARLARTGEFAAVHAFWPLPHGLLGLAAGAAGGIPVISTFFGVELTWVQSGLPAARPIVREIIRRSDAVTAISTYTAGLVKRIEPLAEPVVIPFGAAVEPKRVARRARPAGELRLLFVGRLVERKGVHVLLEALARLARRGAAPPLDVVGDGPERPRLEALASELGVASLVRFHGFVPDAALRRALEDTDCLVLPAVHDRKGDVEGLGVVLLEAMGAGKPVIASAAGGITDIVEDAETGLLVEPGNAEALAAAIARLRDDPDLAARLADAGALRVAERFSWSSITERLVTLYRTVAHDASEP